MNEYVLGSEAGLDLEDVWEYIATDSAAADRWSASEYTTAANSSPFVVFHRR